MDFVSTAWDLGVRVNLRQAGNRAVGEPGCERGFSLLTSKPGMTWQRRAPTELGVRGRGRGSGSAGRAVSSQSGCALRRSDADFAARRTVETRYIIADIGLVLAF